MSTFSSGAMGLSWYRFGYRGIYFNLLLTGLIVLANGLLFKPALAANDHQQQSLLLAVVLVTAFLVEPVFFYRRLCDVSAQRYIRGLPKLSKGHSGTIIFLYVVVQHNGGGDGVGAGRYCCHFVSVAGRGVIDSILLVDVV